MNLRKHINKILVFAVNLLLMMVAILVIKQKDEAKKALQAQDSLAEDNSAVLNENERLKSELESLKGVLEGLSAKISEPENIVVPDAVQPSKPSQSPSSAAKVTSPAKSTSSNKSNSTSSSTSFSSSSSSKNSASSSNSQTKTS